MKRRNVWVAEERKKRDEEEAKAELKRKVARKGKSVEDVAAADTAHIVEGDHYDFLGSALGAVLQPGDAAVPVLKAKPGKRTLSTGSGSASALSEVKKGRKQQSPAPSPSPSPSPPGQRKGGGKGKGSETGMRPSEIRAKRVREEQKLMSAMQKCQHVLENMTEQTISIDKMNSKAMSSDLTKLRTAIGSQYLDLCKDESAEQLQVGLTKHSEAPLFFMLHFTSRCLSFVFRPSASEFIYVWSNVIICCVVSAR